MTTPTDLSDQAIAQAVMALVSEHDLDDIVTLRGVLRRARELQAQQGQRGGGDIFPAPQSLGDDDIEFWAERLEMLSDVHGCGSVTMKKCAELLRRLSNAGGVVDDAMVERAAIALQAVNDCSSTPWHDLPDYGRNRIRDQARAALCAALGVER